MSGTSSAGTLPSGSEPVSLGGTSHVTSGATPTSGAAAQSPAPDPTVGSGLAGFVYMPRTPMGEIAAWTIIRNAAVIERMTANGQIAHCTRFAAGAFDGSGVN